jgi:hypothetical protein
MADAVSKSSSCVNSQGRFVVAADPVTTDRRAFLRIQKPSSCGPLAFLLRQEVTERHQGGVAHIDAREGPGSSGSANPKARAKAVYFNGGEDIRGDKGIRELVNSTNGGKKKKIDVVTRPSQSYVWKKPLQMYLVVRECSAIFQLFAGKNKHC